MHRTVRDLEICDIDVIEHGDVALLAHALGQERLDILAVDLDVAPPARDIIPAFILQDHEPAALEVFRDLVDRLRDCHHEIIADDALRILACILDVVGRRVAVRNVGIERIDTRGQAAAAFDIRFLSDEHAQLLLCAELDSGITASRAAADDEHICLQTAPLQLYILHIISPKSTPW